jgi:hypothetical protein
LSIRVSLNMHPSGLTWKTGRRKSPGQNDYYDGSKTELNHHSG